MESILFDYDLGTCVIRISDIDFEIDIHEGFENWLSKNGELEKIVGYDSVEMTMEEFVLSKSETHLGDLHIDFLKTLDYKERRLLFINK